MKKKFPANWWTLSFMAGSLDGQTKRYPYCPADYAHQQDRYTLLEKNDSSRTATLVRQCKTSSESR